MKILSTRSKLFITLLICMALLVGIGFTILNQSKALAVSTVVQQVSSDPFTNDTSQHQTQVQGGTLSHGTTVVSTFQSGRFQSGGGSSGISWATSLDSGLTWKQGTLQGITTYAGGPYARASDSMVAYDPAHHIWLISALVAKTTFSNSRGSTGMVVSRSTNGLNWSKPVVIAESGPNDNFDKDWISCDDHKTSPFYGRCYEEWDNDIPGSGQIMMSYSTDGGLTWSAPQSPANQSIFGVGGVPVVQPNGHVVVPIYGYDHATGAEGIYSYQSTDGGASWSDPLEVSPSIYSHAADFYRSGSLPSAAVDKDGKVYLTWAGCYFETDCANDDIVLTTSTDGLTWTPIQRIPLSAIGSGVENITAGVTVDNSTGGSKAHLAVTYYYWPDAGCTASTCQISVGVASSLNGGATWSKPQAVAGPTMAIWWALTDRGYMIGDYTTITISQNRIVTVVSTAKAPDDQTFNQYMVGASLPVTGGSTPCDTLKSSIKAQDVPQQSQPTKDYHSLN